MTFTPQTVWQKTTLGTLAEFRNGVNFSKESFGTGIRVIGVSDFQDNVRASYETLDEINPEGVVRKEHLLKNGDILFVRSNGNRELIGRNMYVDNVPGPVTHSAFSIRLRFTSKQCHSRFYAYLFRSDLIRQSLSLFGGGTNISNLNQDILGRLEVPVPPMWTQERVADILSAYDELIENNTRRIAILEQMAQMFYREWFVNFRFPGHEKVKLVESELGLIPEGWDVERLDESAKVVMGQSPRSEFYNTDGKGLPFHQGVTNFGSLFPITRSYCSSEGRIAERGDILMSVRAPVGRLNIAREKIVIGRGLSAIRSRAAWQELLFQQLKERFHEEDSMGSGTIFKAVTKEDVCGLKFAQPTATVANRFVQTVSPMVKQLETLTAKNTNLRTTRDLLLPKLVSGEVSVESLEEEALAETV